MMKKVLTIAGSDCSGGAGIQADLKTFSAHGVFGMSVIVSVVAENTSRVIDIQDITPKMIEKQIDAVFEDIEVDAVKVGMLSTPECMRAVAGKLRQYKPEHVVIDSVMYAKNGCPLMDPSAVDALIETILPLADVRTLNIPEAERITGVEIRSVTDMEAAARKIHDMGSKTVVVKGGHAIGNALEYLKMLKESGIKLAVATGLPEKLFVPCLENNSVLGLFDALCSTDEVIRGKEFPDVFELAARRLEVAPERCLVFDDVLPAVRSAKQAGMLVCGVYDKYSAHHQTEIERISNHYIKDFTEAPLPGREI